MQAEFQVQARLADGIGDLIRLLNILSVADARLEAVDASVGEGGLEVVVRFRSEADRAALCHRRVGRLPTLVGLGELAGVVCA